MNYNQEGVTIRRVDLALWQIRIADVVGTEHGRRKAIAKAAGMSPSQFSDLINIPGKNPEIRQLQRIADALDVEVGVFFLPGSHPLGGSPHAEQRQSATGAPIARSDFIEILRSVLTAALFALSNADAPAGEQGANSRPEKSDQSTVSPERRRAVR